ncbi:MAG: flagellar biosynthesis protein FlhB [Rhodobacteraceae bacterium]|nr:MAG: flagellar biosynthesis protein FlhB [Paracoccaceae bacterium]
MAEENESQEKTEEPSQRKLEQAKEDGKVLTSKEMYVFTTLSMAFLFMIVISLFMKPFVVEWSNLFNFDQRSLDQFTSIKRLQISNLYDSYLFILKITLIVGLPLFLTVCITQTAVGGINFSTKALAFKGSKLDPIKGIKKIFSIKGLVELGKAILKIILLFGISIYLINLMLPSLLNIPNGSLANAIEQMKYAFPKLLGGLLIALLIIAAIDYFWQSYTHKKELMMSRQDQKDEYKQTEGSPEVKAKIRRMQMETAANSTKQREAVKDVSEATAVITNPTHFAVALKYTVGEPGAPKVLAMGRGKIAEEIIKKASDHNLTIFQSPLLARALYYTSEIGIEISEQLYSAVAIALAYIYKLEQGESIIEPVIDIPSDLQFDEFGNKKVGDTNA